jgi:hypothetical protein
MNSKQLLEAADVLDWVSVMLKQLPEVREDALAASLHCTVANMVVVELAKHLTDGVEPYEALRLAAVGSLTMRPQKREILRLLAAMTGPQDQPPP